MKPVYAKEIRLLQPAYLMALLLAVVPVWLFPSGPNDTPAEVAATVMGFGLIILGLSAFGREFSLGTYGLLLAQPEERRRIWRIKSGLLAAAMVSVFVVWCVSCAICLRNVSYQNIKDELFVGAGVGVVVAFASGLWTTLLLRQVTAAFWITLLVPMVIAIVMQRATGWATCAVYVLYSVVGYWWARHLFLNSQEVAWTGGEVTLPAWGRSRVSASARGRNPRSALLWKEIKLQQVALAGMAGLFVMHLIVVSVRSMHYDFSETVRTILEVFGGLWVVVPLLVSATSVAEERKLGTHAQQMSLPVSGWTRFGIKLGVTLAIGLLCAVLAFTAEIIGKSGKPWGEALAMVIGFFLCLAFVGFYASTLARNVIQALAIAVVSMMLIGVFVGFGPHPGLTRDFSLWRGFLIFYIGCPALLVTLFWLAWQNFRADSGGDHLLGRNAVVVGSVLAGTFLLNSAVYNRFWEFLSPLEPRPGTARIFGEKPVAMTSYAGSCLAAVLPDGRLWVDRVNYEPGSTLLSFGEGTGFMIGGHWTSLSGNRLATGSNWIAAVMGFRDTVAIRSDGTLWVSEKPRHPRDKDNEPPRFQEESALVQVGTDTDWRDIAQQYTFSLVLLKRDGTLWQLGTNSLPGKVVWVGLRNFTPRQLVGEAGWDRILPCAGVLYAWKTNGSAWAVHEPGPSERNRTNEMGVVIDRAAYLDGTKWRGMARFIDDKMGLREDGSLWAWPDETTERNNHFYGFAKPHPVQISPDIDWAEIAGQYQTLSLRKTDGSIWQWSAGGRRDWNAQFPDISWFNRPPVRLGSRNDWLAVGAAWDGCFALAADGNLYFWWDRSPYYSGYGYDQPMLAPSRRPSFIENICENGPAR